MILIVAGVSGTGKTTVGALLAGRLHWRFADADTFHPKANVAKMRSGAPLTDADREPWLRAITNWMDERLAAGESAVITCSALKRAYRDRLLDGRPATMAFLEASPEVLDERLRTRPGHFFPEKLLNSQLTTLEPPAPDEKRVHVVVSESGSEATAAKVLAAVWPDGEPLPGGAPAPGPGAVRLAVTWVNEADARPARHLQQRGGDREGLAGQVRRGRREEGTDDRDHPRQGIGPAKEARAALPGA